MSLQFYTEPESTRMPNLLSPSYCQADFDRLHLFWCSTSEISRNWYTWRTLWKRWISKHFCFYWKYKLFLNVYSVFILAS